MKDQPGVVQCLECNVVLVSNHQHDYVCCECPQGTFVDGGRAYLRYGGLDLAKVRPLRLSMYPKRTKK
jgi:hypothetical protein